MDKITALEKSIVNLAVQISDANTPTKDVADEEYEDDSSATTTSETESSNKDENVRNSLYPGSKRNRNSPSSVSSDLKMKFNRFDPHF